ncbi:MAG: hypothetical protein IT457_16675 [Planctomycetes bacterium]|nr:hypothetical protein [Planctomycetota bacterium]
MMGDRPATGEGPLARALSHRAALAAWCMLATFGSYAAMYGFRKPFTAAAFAEPLAGSSLKVWLVVAQVLGYALAKFIGIRVIAEMTRARRLRTLLALIAVAELALLGFALTPAPYCVGWLFVNGLCLGQVFGLVLGFAEGRRLSELFIAGLCASFIFADGLTKAVGATLLDWGIAEAWMPAAAGGLFLAPLLLGAWMLARIPEPSAQDIADRAPRLPLTRAERLDLLRRHGLGLVGVFLAYLAITVLRSVRADFAPELWRALGHAASPSLFARSETWVAAAVLVVSASLVLVRDHRRALAASLALSGLGLLVGLFALGLFRAQSSDAFLAMVGLGFGLYVPYVLVHTAIFERWIALSRERANVGFLMYVADATGYLGYAVVMLAGQGLRDAPGFLDFFVVLAGITATVALLGFALAGLLLVRAKAPTPDPTRAPAVD